MKRSEIINLIADYFYECNVDARESFSLANELLDELEHDAKMLPPATMIYTDLPSGNTLCSEECVWDKEDA